MYQECILYACRGQSMRAQFGLDSQPELQTPPAAILQCEFPSKTPGEPHGVAAHPELSIGELAFRVRVAFRVHPHLSLAKCRHAMAALRRAMRWDEERFGREYDLDTFMIFCADDFNMGAMENKGLNIFNSQLCSPTRRRRPTPTIRAIEGVIGHEYFHNWTGNRVTCRDWFQLSLKEGLTVFRDQEFSSDIGLARRRARSKRSTSCARSSSPRTPVRWRIRCAPTSYAEINNFYTATVYEKGAEVIRMQHALLGTEAFRRGMDLYFERHDGQAVTCDDFVQAMQDASGVDLAPVPPLVQPGRHAGACGARATTTPRRARTRSRSCSRVRRRPASRHKRPLHIPLAVGLSVPDGARPAAASRRRWNRRRGAHHARRCTCSAGARSVSSSSTCRERPVPSLLRGFSAPVKLDLRLRPKRTWRCSPRTTATR